MSLCSHEHHDALHGVHDHQNIEQRLAEAESLCAATGARLTPLRREVLELFYNASGPVRPPAAPPTVYRTLDFLLEKGLIHRLTSINAYIPCCHPREGHQAAFLICTECKVVKEASAQGLLQQLAELSASDHFTAHHSIIEISGLCQHCASKR